jgi:phage-related protein
VATQAVYYRAADGFAPVEDFLDREFPLEPRKKNPSAREIEAAASKRMTIDLQIDRLNGLANDDPPLPFPHTSQIDGPLRELRCHYGRAHYRILYRRSGNLFVLLHMIRKTSKAPPPAASLLSPSARSVSRPAASSRLINDITCSIHALGVQ